MDDKFNINSIICWFGASLQSIVRKKVQHNLLNFNHVAFSSSGVLNKEPSLVFFTVHVIVNSQARLAMHLTVCYKYNTFLSWWNWWLIFCFFIVVAFCREDFTERRQHHSSNEYTVELMVVPSTSFFVQKLLPGVCLKLA